MIGPLGKTLFNVDADDNLEVRGVGFFAPRENGMCRKAVKASNNQSVLESLVIPRSFRQELA